MAAQPEIGDNPDMRAPLIRGRKRELRGGGELGRRLLWPVWEVEMGREKKRRGRREEWTGPARVRGKKLRFKHFQLLKLGLIKIH